MVWYYRVNKAQTIEYLLNSLKPVQQKMLVQFVNSKKRMSVFHCSRRLGKTHLLCVISIVFALKKSNSQIRYASVTQKALRKMVHPIFKDLFNQIPEKYRGTWNSQEGAYTFANGSQVHLAGCNGDKSDDLRGTSADLALVDEASFIDDLGYLVDSVLMPQLLTVPGSRLIMASSSPLSPAHEFCDYIAKARIEKTYHSYTIHQGGYSKDLIQEFCLEAGGEKSTTWLREYLNEIIVDSDYAIIPEAARFTPGTTTTEYREYYRPLASMDIGTRDLTVILFGYYDFKRAKLVIEREFIINGPQMTTPLIADGVKKIEEEIGSKLEPYRVADNNNLLLLQDLGYLHGCHFTPTNKDTLEAMVNEMRIWFANGRIEIADSCPVLIESIKFGFWNEQRRDFGRSSTLGHFDAIAALMYLIRNIDQTTNPIPVKVGFDDFYLEEDNSNYSDLASIMNI